MQAWLNANIDLPALVFGILLAVGLWVLHKAQSDPANNFDMKDMLRDESGKPSSFRFFGFVSLAGSTWALMYITIKTAGAVDPWIYLGYMAIWSGAAVASKFIEAYGGRGAPQQPPSGTNQ